VTAAQLPDAATIRTGVLHATNRRLAAAEQVDEDLVHAAM
jgi:hypothetical protein